MGGYIMLLQKGEYRITERSEVIRLLQKGEYRMPEQGDGNPTYNTALRNYPPPGIP